MTAPATRIIVEHSVTLAGRQLARCAWCPNQATRELRWALYTQGDVVCDPCAATFRNRPELAGRFTTRRVDGDRIPIRGGKLPMVIR